MFTQALEAAQAELATTKESEAKQRQELEKKLKSAQDYIQQQLQARQEIESRFYAMKDDLLTRLHNACAQRDEARGQVSIPLITTSCSLDCHGM